MKRPRLLQPKKTYTVDYPEAIEFARKQTNIFWTPDEIKVEKDVQDILVNMTESERHGVITVLKLFTQYELVVGTEYWGGKIMKLFRRPEIQRMAALFSAIELAVHAPFYDKINKELGLSTDEFYSSYTNDETLKSRMEYIDTCLDDSDVLFSLGVFALVEGAVLYSNFAFLKHFQSQGKNKLNNIVAGINFSVRDENVHHEAGAWLFRTLKAESNLTEEQEEALHLRIVEACEKIAEHEHRIVDMIFEKGKMDGITPTQLKNFDCSRLDGCLKELGYKKHFKPSYDPISEWFYKGINAPVLHDFFNRVGASYNRNWDESSFNW